MFHSFDLWKLLAGVAIFLLGMKFLEESLQQLTGRSFKLFLKKQTQSKIKAITGGAIVTAILQSSSVVNLMVLAFVGANVIQMQNALALILGANLGTTFSSWLIAIAGFKLNINNIAYPVIGIFGILMTLSNKESWWHRWSKFLCGFGFLLTGLSFIKSGMESGLKEVDLATFNHYPPVVFVLVGLLLTSLTQSSSATIAISLSALHVNAISLYAATAIVLGSEVGTTLKLILASAKGIAAKKRVALGNFLFNTTTIVIVFILLGPLNRLIKNTLHIEDNLLALVFFQSFINIAGIILFYPFLNLFGKFLESRYVTNNEETGFIYKVNAADTELAVAALEKEIKNFLLNAVFFANKTANAEDTAFSKSLPPHINHSKKPAEHYQHLKQLYGEVHTYSLRILDKTNDTAVIQKIEQLAAAARNTMYAAKNIKDATGDINQLSKSSNDFKYNFYLQAAAGMDEFCKKLVGLLSNGNREDNLKTLTGLYENITRNYSDVLNKLYKENIQYHLNDIEISTLINFNREIFTVYKSFIFALKDFLLDANEAARFDELPGFIR